MYIICPSELHSSLWYLALLHFKEFILYCSQAPSFTRLHDEYLYLFSWRDSSSIWMTFIARNENVSSRTRVKTLSHVLPLFVIAVKTKDSLFQHIIIVYCAWTKCACVFGGVCGGSNPLFCSWFEHLFGFKENAFPYEQALPMPLRGLFPGDWFMSQRAAGQLVFTKYGLEPRAGG